jgi:hypothetical protein
LSGGPFISAASSGSVLDEDRDGTTGQFVVGNKLGFKPGQSGNPGGRPKSFGARLLAKLDETHGDKDLYDTLVAGLIEDAQSDDPTVRLPTRKELLARIFPVIAKHELTGEQDSHIEFSWKKTSEDTDDSVQGQD